MKQDTTHSIFISDLPSDEFFRMSNYLTIIHKLFVTVRPSNFRYLSMSDIFLMYYCTTGTWVIWFVTERRRINFCIVKRFEPRPICIMISLWICLPVCLQLDRSYGESWLMVLAEKFLTKCSKKYFSTRDGGFTAERRWIYRRETAILRRETEVPQRDGELITPCD